MLLSLRRAFVFVLMALALLAGLLGWSIRMNSLPMMQHHSSVNAVHVVANAGSPDYICGPPPVGCY